MEDNSMVSKEMNTEMTGNRVFILRKRRVGMPEPADFELCIVGIPEVPEGMVLLKAVLISVDPYLRGKMSGTKSPAFEVGEAISSRLIAEVVESKHAGFRKGQLVIHYLEWKEYQLSDGRGLSIVDPDAAPLSAHLGVLGITGLSAWFALADIGKPRQGETLVVSGAAGAVGSIAGQIGQLMGCRVVGIVGTDQKAALIKEGFGFDEAVNYRTSPDIRAAIAAVCPGGVDIYFDNVGGPVSYGVLANINPYGRVIVCGAISNYNDTVQPMAEDLLPMVVYKFLTVRGFLIGDHAAHFAEGLSKIAGWLQEGKLRYTETVLEGFERLPEALIGLFEGRNAGKMIVRV